MFENKTESEARSEILELVKEYCDTYHNNGKPFEEGDRIPYARRVYDHEEMVNLVDSSLEFWLTSGRYTDQFEKAFAEYLGVKFCSLVNSGSSANLNAFMALTSPLLKERAVKRGDEVITVAAGFPDPIDGPIEVSYVDSDAIPADMEGLDAGPEAQAKFAAAIKGCKTILWNGPAGVFECDDFCAGSRAVGEAIAKATAEGAFSLIGGGDSVACVNKFGLADKVSYISTGGGALLEAIEGKVLPGVAAIKG